MIRCLLVLFLAYVSTSAVVAEDVDLSKYEKSLYSSHGEDGILAKIFQLIQPTSRICAELGAGDGVNGSSTYLFRRQGWQCLLLDRAYEAPEIGLYKAFITAENIDDLFEHYNLSYDLDLLTIDIGYNNFYVWRALSQKYTPKIVVIGYNSTHASHEDKVVKYRPLYCGDQSDYFGASILALYQLGRAKGYSLVYAERTGSTLFFIRDDCLEGKDVHFPGKNDVEKLYRSSQHVQNATKHYPSDAKQRPYVTAASLLQ